jgi:hypothetical protein
MVEDFYDINKASTLAVNEMYKLYGQTYINQAFCAAYDQASGSSDDTCYSALGVKYSMTVELRDTGNFGFLLPKEQIVPQGDELVKGMIELWKYAAQYPTKNFGNMQHNIQRK